MSNAVETSQAVAIFPVRHHSPAASLHVQAMIAKLRPKIILIEGPSDATDLIPLLLADGSEPPIAVLCYFQASGDGNQETEERSGPSSLVSPFCAYSPEYVAMRAGQKIGSVLRFCDIPAGAMLEWRSQDTAPRAPSEQPAPSGEEAINEDGSVPQHIVPTLETQLAALAEHFDRRDSNEFWDTYFEMSARALNDAAGFTRQMHAYGDLVRDWYEPDEPPMVASAAAVPDGAEAANPEAQADPAQPSDRPALGGRQIDFDRFREAFMRTEIRRALAEGYKPEEIMVVCGAAHASALSLEGSDFSFDSERVNEAKSAKAATLTLIPYSYARLSEQSGYGAGNRAPAYYQQVWENKGDFASATRKFLLLAMNNMHAKGHAISLADAIEAERLAWTLAAVRDKPAPGLEELEDAARACYGRGALDTKGFLQPLLIGDALGKLSSKVERTPLQQDFYAGTSRLRIPLADSPKKLDKPPMRLQDPRDLQRSVFLHRLQVAGVPFATLSRSGRAEFQHSSSRHTQGVSADNLNFDHLRNMMEIWEVQWTPHTDIRLIELSIEGDRVRDVCARLLRRELDAAQDISAITKILLRAVLANIPELYNRILRRCDEAVAEGSDLHVLAQAGNHLHQLAQYGSTRKLDPALFTSLLTRVYTRAALLLPAGAIVGDDEAAKVVSALKLLHELSSRRSDLDASLLNERLALVADTQGNAEGKTESTVHPSIAGLAATLLLLRGAISQDDLATLMGRRLSGAEEPQRGAQFLEGLLALNRAMLLRNRDIVGWLNFYLQSLSSEAFMHTLPVLRRAMSELSKAEIGVLMTTLAPLLGIKERIQETALLEPKHLAELRAIDAELAALLAEEL
ncbi:MAG TPA: DUF5682 family protein [Ktedonobacterales bacterium]|nr:DUF5682 family protein [Ktedonobacterales bacterium]